MSGSTRLVVRPSAWASVPPDPMGPLHRLMASNLLARYDARAVGAGSMALQARAADASVADAGGRSPGRRPSPTPRQGPGAETPSPGKHKGLSPATVGGDRAGAWPFHTETPHGRPPEKKRCSQGTPTAQGLARSAGDRSNTGTLVPIASGPRAFAQSAGPPPGALLLAPSSGPQSGDTARERSGVRARRWRFTRLSG